MKLKALFLSILLCVLFGSVQAQDDLSAKGIAAKFAWDAQSQDLGTLAVGDKGTQTFTFKNEGKIPLMISSVTTSWGATLSNYSKSPIPPGGSGKIVADYTPKKSGAIKEYITVVSNAESFTVSLTLTGKAE